MAGLHIPSIQTVTAKAQLSQSSVLGNIFLEDTQVSHGVSDMINFILSLASLVSSAAVIWVVTQRFSPTNGCFKPSLLRSRYLGRHATLLPQITAAEETMASQAQAVSQR